MPLASLWETMQPCEKSIKRWAFEKEDRKAMADTLREFILEKGALRSSKDMASVKGSLPQGITSNPIVKKCLSKQKACVIPYCFMTAKLTASV
jgi:hypothetical protein